MTRLLQSTLADARWKASGNLNDQYLVYLVLLSAAGE